MASFCQPFLGLLLGAIPLGMPGLLQTQPPAAQIEFFEKKIRPVLVQHCYSCHAADAKKIKGGLLLDSREAVLKGGDSGPVIVPGNPEQSLLLQALRHEGPKMPPTGKLPPSVVDDFTAWIKAGALDPRVARPEAAPSPRIDVALGRKFWAFQPPARHPLPQVSDGGWPRQVSDYHILRRLDQEQLRPSRPADRHSWLRRVTFDLIGLPPTPEELARFLADASPQAEAAAVERLLASPRYGERWARLWLDVVRYAEDQAHIVGNDQSLTYPNAYLYRDWVVRALNEDMPYDRFLRLQLAGDLIEPENPSAHVATGLLGLGPKYYSRRNLAVMSDEWEDRVDVVCRGLMGLTVACARCHDHKYDPVTTEDYYALAGVFASSEMFNRPLDPKPAAIDPKQEKKADDKGRAPSDAMHVVKEGTPTDLTVFIRGDVNNKGPQVPRRFVEVLSPDPPRPFRQGSGRLELADAIASRDNPLTARVIVNRVWGQLFGRPLVATASNFGSLGERPTHPELLDDLAVRFMEAGWSLKWLHREIVLSAAYAQTSQAEPESISLDPENRWLGRMSRRRLSVEAWRDSILAASGALSPQLGGPSMNPAAPQERRRTLYSTVSRLELNRMLALFDYPDPNLHADRRVETTTPLQKLFVLNSPFLNHQARLLSDRLAAEVPGDSPDARRQRILALYQLLYQRRPSERELALAFEFLAEETDWPSFCHALLAANEMLFVD